MIIGLCGAMRSGKDTVASFIVEQGWVRVAFADSLREELERLNPILENDTDSRHLCDLLQENNGWEGLKGNPEWLAEQRLLLQDYGMRIRSERGEDYWVNHAFQKIDTQRNTVITDVRLPNEVDAIRARGGFIVRVVNPNLKTEDLPGINHITERALLGVPVDAIISTEPFDTVPERVGKLVRHFTTINEGVAS